MRCRWPAVRIPFRRAETGRKIGVPEPEATMATVIAFDAAFGAGMRGRPAGRAGAA